jgi:murein DD-endopeptidase MepM/ murein hydrolase activator NlpD
MKQHYFVVVLAHSLHGRLRRIHIPHQTLYVVLGLALFGSVSLFGMVSSYLRMTWKVSNYNSLRSEVETLRSQYHSLQRENDQKQEQLASLQLMASEVSMSLGIKRQFEGPENIMEEGPLVPSYSESIEQYNFLKFANLSHLQRTFPRQWQKNVIPSLWPVSGRLLSNFGGRLDPFSGEGAFHTGVDIQASPGTPVHSAADGVVLQAEYSGGYGKLVVVDHGNGIRTMYGHLSKFNVVPGQEVRKGAVIAFSGSTGASTGPHLHFEVRMRGSAVNPYPYLARSATFHQTTPDLPF